MCDWPYVLVEGAIACDAAVGVTKFEAFRYFADEVIVRNPVSLLDLLKSRYPETSVLFLTMCRSEVRPSPVPTACV
jgi:hypothetical protein